MALAQITIRRGTTAEWAAANPVLGDGEMGYDSTLKRVKVGDGVSSWVGLGWSTMSPGEVQSVLAAATIIDQADTPTDASVANLITTPGSQTNTQLSAAIAGVVADLAPGVVEPAVVAVGDSMTKTTGIDWPATMLEPLLGVDVENFGYAGWASTDIAVQFGAVRPKLTLAGGQIPASGPVAVTAISPTTRYRSDGSGAISWDGELAGVPGTLRHNPAPSESWVFTRATSGSAVAVPAGTEFAVAAGEPFRKRTMVLWVGRNNGGDMDPALRDTDLMIDYQAVAAKRALILGVVNATSEYGSNAIYQAILRYNRIAAKRYEHFLDIRRYLIDNGLVLAGINPTATDRGDISNDAIPTSLHLEGDSLHLNAAGCQVVATAVAQYFAVHGWVAGLIPAETPGKVTGLAAGTATDTTVPLSWTAVTGATAYKVERRRNTPQSGWTFDSVVSGTAKTPSGLALGTAFDFRVTAYNSAGAGVSSEILTATTTGVVATVVGSDSFDAADTDTIHGRQLDNTLGGSGTRTWAVGGTNQVGIRSNQLARSGLSSSRTVRTDAGTVDGWIEAVVPALPDGSTALSLLVRATDDNNTYRVDITPTGIVSLRKTVAGTTTTIPGGSASGVVAGDVVSARASGSTLSFYQNGSLLASVTDTSITTGTLVGFLVPASALVRVDSVRLLS